MNCNCIQLLNEKLAEEGLELDTYSLSPEFHQRIGLPTRRVGSRETAKKKIAINYCPQCGKHVEK